MKKLIIFQILIFFAASSFAQKWKATTIDDSVQVSFPGKFTKKDTLGQTIFNAETSFGQIIITKQADNPATTPDIEKVKQLKDYYDEFIKSIQSSSKGTVSDERDTVIGNLKVKDFKLEVDSGSGKQFRNIRILHVNSATYTFQFLYKDIHKEYATAESEQFFGLIRIPPESAVTSQFTDPQNTTGKKPGGQVNYYLIGAIAFIILIVIFILIKRQRKRH